MRPSLLAGGCSPRHSSSDSDCFNFQQIESAIYGIFKIADPKRHPRARRNADRTDKVVGSQVIGQWYFYQAKVSTQPTQARHQFAKVSLTNTSAAKISTNWPTIDRAKECRDTVENHNDGH
jgi:hypothetical protein